MARRGVLLLVVLLTACGGVGEGEGPVLAGEDLAAEVGCLACHQETDTGTAPTLHGIWGTRVALRTGVP